eukprot:216248-Alexandrium_andersonii.AAC.1
MSSAPSASSAPVQPAARCLVTRIGPWAATAMYMRRRNKFLRRAAGNQGNSPGPVAAPVPERINARA